ncbi:MAG: SCP2 sterol-binding domain-containing protein [Nitrososphaerales archaeon]
MAAPRSFGLVKFFTIEFFRALVDQLSRDASLTKLTKGMKTTLLLGCTGKDSAFLITVLDEHLDLSEVSSNEKAEFRFTAPYERWEKIARGEAKMQGDVLSGRIRFRGSMTKMLLYVNRVIGLERKAVEIMKGMDILF